MEHENEKQQKYGVGVGEAIQAHFHQRQAIIYLHLQ